LGTSSCPEEPSKSKEMLHKLRASLSILLANRVILPLQTLQLSSREKLTPRESLCESGEAMSARCLNGRRKVGVGTCVNHLT
nr:hypothetical protein [Tanacetum cinerariifolium]